MLVINKVQFKLSLAYKHSLNRIIKQAISIIAIIARSIIYKARLLYQMWDYAIKYAIWIKNRVLTAALLFGDKDINVATSITLYRAFTSNYFNFDKLQVFRCKAVLYKINVNYLMTFKP